MMIKIKSISDVVTNSSSETWIYKKNSKQNIFFINKLKEKGLLKNFDQTNYFKSIKDIKRFLLESSFCVEGWPYDKSSNQLVHGDYIIPNFNDLYKKFNYKDEWDFLNKFEAKNVDKILDYFSNCIDYNFYRISEHENGFNEIYKIGQKIDKEFLKDLINNSVPGNKYETLMVIGPILDDSKVTIEITNDKKYKISSVIINSIPQNLEYYHHLENIEDLIEWINVFKLNKIK